MKFCTIDYVGKVTRCVQRMITIGSVGLLPMTGAKVLKGERILFNAVKDIYFTRKMQFKKLNNSSSVKK
jgi:hypothetical protein